MAGGGNPWNYDFQRFMGFQGYQQPMSSQQLSSEVIAHMQAQLSQQAQASQQQANQSLPPGFEGFNQQQHNQQPRGMTLNQAAHSSVQPCQAFSPQGPQWPPQPHHQSPQVPHPEHQAQQFTGPAMGGRIGGAAPFPAHQPSPSSLPPPQEQQQPDRRARGKRGGSGRSSQSQKSQAKSPAQYQAHPSSSQGKRGASLPPESQPPAKFSSAPSRGRQQEGHHSQQAHASTSAPRNHSKKQQEGAGAPSQKSVEGQSKAEAGGNEEQGASAAKENAKEGNEEAESPDGGEQDSTLPIMNPVTSPKRDFVAVTHLYAGMNVSSDLSCVMLRWPSNSTIRGASGLPDPALIHTAPAATELKLEHVQTQQRDDLPMEAEGSTDSAGELWRVRVALLHGCGQEGMHRLAAGEESLHLHSLLQIVLARKDGGPLCMLGAPWRREDDGEGVTGRPGEAELRSAAARALRRSVGLSAPTAEDGWLRMLDFTYERSGGAKEHSVVFLVDPSICKQEDDQELEEGEEEVPEDWLRVCARQGKSTRLSTLSVSLEHLLAYEQGEPDEGAFEANFVGEALQDMLRVETAHIIMSHLSHCTKPVAKDCAPVASFTALLAYRYWAPSGFIPSPLLRKALHYSGADVPQWRSRRLVTTALQLAPIPPRGSGFIDYTRLCSH